MAWMVPPANQGRRNLANASWRASNAPIPRQTAAKVALWSAVIAFGACFVLGLDYPPVREWDLWRLVLPAAALSFAMFAWTSAFVLHGYSLASRGPAGEAADARLLEHWKARWALLTGALR